MEPNRIFSAEQISVPPDLPGILKEWTKEVIRKNPEDLLLFSAEYFQQQANIANKGKLPIEELQKMRGLFDKYDVDGNGKMESTELKSFIKIDLGYDISDEYLDKVIQLLDVDQSGYLEFGEIVNWWAGEC